MTIPGYTPQTRMVKPKSVATRRAFEANILLTIRSHFRVATAQRCALGVSLGFDDFYNQRLQMPFFDAVHV